MLALAGVLAGCGSAPTVQPPAGGRLQVWPVHAGARCPQAPALAGPATSLAAGRVREFVLCPLAVPGSHGHPVRVGRGDAAYPELVDQLTRPSIPPTKGQPCPLYADAIQIVLARAEGRWWMVRLPVDGCGHYLTGVVSLLNRLRS